MLEKAEQFLKIGGFLVYCVCSIHSSEGSYQIETFRKIKILKLLNSITLSVILENFKKGMLTIIPEDFGCNAEADGFFISILKRIK